MCLRAKRSRTSPWSRSATTSETEPEGDRSRSTQCCCAGGPPSGADRRVRTGEIAVWINVTTIGDLLDQRADDSPCRNALVMPDVRLTYAQLSAASDRLAATLLEFDIGRGDKVG